MDVTSCRWAERLLSDPDRGLSYQDLRDCYQYLRSTANLLERSKLKPFPVEYQRCLSEIESVFTMEKFGHLLDITHVIRSLEKAGLGPSVEYAARVRALGLGQERFYDEVQTRTMRHMRDNMRAARASEWQYRLTVAIDDCISNGWFPLFGTYTVDPKKLPEGIPTRDDLWRETSAWNDFVYAFKREVAASLGYGRKPANWPPVATWFQYMAVLEHGASTEHPHVHVVWMCKNIPLLWKRDPNRVGSGCTNLDISAASALWPWGSQKRTQGVFVTGSWFKDNWRHPVDPNTLEPIKIGTPGAMAGYVSKYMTKGERKWKHRVKATKNLGLFRIRCAMKDKANLRVLLQLARRPTDYGVAMAIQLATSAPLGLLRRLSKEQLSRRLHDSSDLLAEKWICRLWTKRRRSFFTNLMSAVESGTRIWTLPTEQRYNCYTRMLEASKNTALYKKGVDLFSFLDYAAPRREYGEGYVCLQE